MAEVIETQAAPIEQAIEPTSGLDQLVAGITSEAERLAQEYMPREIVTDEDYKQSKRERTGARKDIAALKGRYDERMRAIKDAVKEADARVKAALAPLDAIDSGYKAEVDAYESRWRSARLADLAEAYADYAPDLVDLVPFERLRARFGNEKGRQWDARSVSDAQAEEAMHKAVQAIASDEATIDGSPYDESDKAALKADYFATLDLSGALRRTQEAKEQRERVARLEQERREREAEQRRMAEEAERRRREEEAAQQQIAMEEPIPAPAPQPARQRQDDHPIIDTHTQMTPGEYQEYLAATSGKAPQPITSHQEMVRGLSGAQTVLVALYSVTGAQMRKLAATLSGQGIHGKPKGTGMLLSESQCADLLSYATTRARGYDAPAARKEL